MNNVHPSTDRVIVKRKLYDDGKSSPVFIYASIDKSAVDPGELTFSGKFVSYGRRAGFVSGQIIELWQEIYIGDGEPEATPYVP